MKNAFRTLSFRSEPTIGEEHLRRSAKCTAEAPSTRGDLVVEKKYEDLIHDFVPDCFEYIQNFHHYRSDLARINSGFKVIYLSDSERTANSENDLRKVYKQYVKCVSPNSSFKGHLQRVRGNTMQPEKMENENAVSKDTLYQKCGYEGIEKCDRRLEASTRYLEVLGKIPGEAAQIPMNRVREINRNSDYRVRVMAARMIQQVTLKTHVAGSKRRLGSSCRTSRVSKVLIAIFLVQNLRSLPPTECPEDRPYELLFMKISEVIIVLTSMEHRLG